MLLEMNVDRDKAEHILIEADTVAGLVMEGFDMTMETPEGRALYERAFTTFIKSEIDDTPMATLYDALKGTGAVASRDAA